MGIQLTAILITIIFSVLMTFIILKLINKFIKIRVSNEEEHEGIDVSQHGEEAYGGLNI